MISDTPKDGSEAKSVVAQFAHALGGIEPNYHIKRRPDGEFLVIEFARDAGRMYDLLESINAALTLDNAFKDKITISTRKKRPDNPLKTPEVAILQKEIAASLTVDRNTFGSNFLERYMPSVTDLETQVVVNANHVVYGRRGSGKSSLLAYAMHKLRAQEMPYAWVAMQTYAGRTDQQAIASVLSEIFRELQSFSSSPEEISSLAAELMSLGEEEDEEKVVSKLNRLTPRMRKIVGEISHPKRPTTIFLDDLHVLGQELQPRLLATIYSLARGNATYIKISGIAQLTNLWNGTLKLGLEAPHDVQTLLLDHNLTNPDQSKEHIKSIIDRHASYCALPGISYISSDDFIDRLVLSAAAVPRDALSLLTKSIARSLAKNQKALSITSLNAATSEAIEEKLKDIGKDVPADETSAVSACLEQVKDFCLKQNKKNAFLVKIENGSAGYNAIEKLIALRFVHVLHDGITPHRAGERYFALMLDFGFYVGIRAARSVALFPDRPRQLLAKELRKLPILDVGSHA